MFKGTKIGYQPDFSIEMMETKRQWNDIFKLLKENHRHLGVSFLPKNFFKGHGERNIYNKYREIFISRYSLTREFLKCIDRHKNSKKNKK